MTNPEKFDSGDFWDNSAWYASSFLVPGMRLRLSGLPFATALFDFYYSAPPEGSSYPVSFGDHQKVISHAPTIDADERSEYFAHDGKDLIQFCIDKIVEEARENVLAGKYGFEETQELREGWVPAKKLYADDDLANALGGFYMGVGADIVVHKPGSNPSIDNGNRMSATMRYTPYIYDFYYFHGTAEFDWMELGAGWTADKYLRFSEKCGQARSFHTRGNSVVLDWQGAIGPF